MSHQIIDFFLLFLHPKYKYLHSNLFYKNHAFMLEILIIRSDNNFLLLYIDLYFLSDKACQSQ